MVVVPSCCLALAVVLFFVGLRGRVVARGVFCRRCRFDLAGIDRDRANARCPECGHRIGEGGQPRTVLRRRRRGLLAAAVVLQLVGVAGLWAGASGKTATLMGVLSDGAIVWLTERGVDEALDELARRAGDTISPMPDAMLARAIELALEHQADVSAPWDPRWGEVLLVNFQHPVFTDEQRMRCLGNGFEVSIEMGDRIRQGDETLYCTLNFRYARFTSLSSPAIPGWVKLRPVELTADGRLQSLNASFGSFSVPLAPRVTLNNQTLRYGQAPLPLEIDDQEPRAIGVVLRYEIVYQPVAALARPLRTITQTKRIDLVSRDQPTALLVQDEAIAGEIGRMLRVSALRMMREPPEDSGDADPHRLFRTASVMGLHCAIDALPEPIALRCQLRFQDGDTFDPGWTWIGSERNGRLHPAYQRRGMYWPTGEDLEPHREQARRMLGRLREQERVDLLIYTDPMLANKKIEIRRVIDLSLIVRDLPIEWVDEQHELRERPTSASQWRTPEPMPEPMLDAIKGRHAP